MSVLHYCSDCHAEAQSLKDLRYSRVLCLGSGCATRSENAELGADR